MSGRRFWALNTRCAMMLAELPVALLGPSLADAAQMERFARGFLLRRGGTIARSPAVRRKPAGMRCQPRLSWAGMR